MLRKKRLKIAIAAILFGLVSSVIEMPLPLEDLYRAARAQLRAQPAPQDIAFIAIDDRTMQAFSGKIPGRENDARVVDNLFRAGVTKVTFDRAHADPGDTESDAVFAQMLERHKGKVWLGFSPTVQIGMQSVDEMVPLPAFRKRANIAAMNGYGTPFGLSVSFGTEVELHGERHPSLSAVLADYDGQPMRYRPDYAFIPSTIPTFSFVDVLNGKVGAAELRGKNVIVGESFVRSTDFYIIPFSSELIAEVVMALASLL